MKKLLFRWLPLFGLLALLFSLNSCRILNPNIMLRTGKNFKFDTLTGDSTFAKEFRLGPNDIIELRLFANDGFKMIDIISSGGSSTNNNTVLRQGFEYTLDNEGVAKLPILGNVNLSGMTVREGEAHLQKRYEQYYVSPFVILKIINKRCIVFPGEPGQAKVVGLSNNNTSVLEVLASVGGISENGKAYNVKLIRQTNDPKHPTRIYKLDLSRIEGLKYGQTIVQSNDIIYVEPRRQLASKTLREVTPILTLLTSLLTVFFIVKRF